MKKGSPDIVQELLRRVKSLEAQARNDSKIIGDLIASVSGLHRAAQSLKDISADHSEAIGRLFSMHEDPEHHGERLH
jgi:hypothetical protein